MYERFESSDRVFVDREEYLEWMDEALERCKEKSVVLHLRGIGGIGKSSLLDHWSNTIESTIRLDCEQYTEFYARLNVLAKGAVHQGVQLRRFDVLWQIRQRFVEGVEPVKEAGREWAKEVVMAIPFVGSLASIGSAISAVSSKVTPKLKGRYGVVGEWLKSSLGKDYLERFLEILWKKPREAEILFLDALREDINNRKNLDGPILFLLDHFEYVDSESERWRFDGRQIAETELWSVFLSLLSCCVGVMAGRKAAKDKGVAEIEESELTELDRESCYELLDLLNMKDKELQERIVSVSGGNPFVIGTICDMAGRKELTIDDVEGLRAGDLEDVRLKTWRRLFSQVQDLQDIINRAGLLPFFDRQVLNIIAPGLTTDQWDRLLRLSFVREIGEGKWVLHDIVEELVVAELGERLTTLTNEVSGLLESAWTVNGDFSLLGLSCSVMAIASPVEALERLGLRAFENVHSGGSRLLEMVDGFKIGTQQGSLEKEAYRGAFLVWTRRFAEAEHTLREALETAEELVSKGGNGSSRCLAMIQNSIFSLYSNQGRHGEAEAMARDCIETYRNQFEIAAGKGEHPSLVFFLWYCTMVSNFGLFLRRSHRLKDSEEMYADAISMIEEFPETESPLQLESYKNDIYLDLSYVQILRGKVRDAEETVSPLLGKFSDPIINAGAYRTVGWTQFLRGRPNEAVKTIHKGLALVETHFKNDPQSFWASIVLCLIRLSVVLRLTARTSEAEESIRRAVDVSRKYGARTEEGPQHWYFPWSLRALAVVLRTTGRTSEAVSMYSESINLFREIADPLAPGRLDELARTLNNNSVLLSIKNLKPDAEKGYLEALEIARGNEAKYPESIFCSDLIGTILNNLGVLLRQTRRESESMKYHEEALRLRRGLAEGSPELFRRRVATSLNNLGVLLAESEGLPAAEDAFHEAIDIRRELVELTPEIHSCSLASSLNNLGILLKLTNRSEEAEAAYRESIAMYDVLFSKAPEVYRQHLARTLSNLFLLLSAVDSLDADDVLKRLKVLGVKEAPQEEDWSEEEEEDYDPL